MTKDLNKDLSTEPLCPKFDQKIIAAGNYTTFVQLWCIADRLQK